jgi:hypothetical protein
MEIEYLKAKAARKLELLVQLATKLSNKYGKDWETKPHPCNVFAVYTNLLKEINLLGDEIEQK